MMTTDTRPQVFISYSTEDIHFVKLLRPRLEAEQIDYWIDRKDLQPGTPSWEDAIREAIKNASAVILIASPHSRRSRYVRDEIAIAEMTGRKIYPIWANGDHWIDCVSLGMGQTQYIDLRGDRRFETNFPDLVQALRSLSPELAYTPPPVQPLPPGVVRRSPYKGLSAFKEEDKDDFFGRAVAVKELIERVGERVNAKQGRLLAVMGASGSGKSSVVMAGLLPRLKAGALLGSEGWLYIPPITPTNMPLRALIRGLTRALPENLFGTTEEDELRQPNGQGLVKLAYKLKQRTLLFIDQFEELFMPGVQPEERDQYINLIVQAANEPDGNLTVLLTLRADFYDRPMNYRDLGELITRHQYGLLPMTLSELREAVEAPALRPDVGLAFEPGLVGEIVFDLRESKDKMALAGALPLLQFTLEQLYERRDTSGAVHTLTMQAYEDIGGVSGAISRHAEAVFTALDEEAQGRLERVFVRLINVDERGEPTRQRTPLTHFVSDRAALRLIATLVQARLLMTNRDEQMATLEVAHESLLRNWERLSKWIEQTAEKKRLLQKLEMDATYWAQRGKPRDQYRYIHEQISEIEAIRESWGITFGSLVDEFLQPEIERLIDDLAGYSFEPKTGTAVERLYNIGSAAVPALSNALNSSDVRIRQNAAELLGRIGDPSSALSLLSSLADTNENVKDRAAQALQELGEDAIPRLIAAIDDTNATVRYNALMELARLGDVVIPHLNIAISDPNESVRSNATLALTQLDDANVVDPLITVLSDKNAILRRMAAEALGRMGDARATPPLRAALLDTDSEVRSSVASALGQLRDMQAVDPLIKSLNDVSSKVRVNAAVSLGKLGDARAALPLIVAFADKDEDVRTNAVNALGELADTSTEETLISGFANEDIETRRKTAEVLMKLEDGFNLDQLVIALTDVNEGVRDGAIAAFTLLGDVRVIEPLIAELSHVDNYRRSGAAAILGKFGDKRAVTSLIAMLNDPSKNVRENVVESLGLLKDVHALDSLITTLSDPDNYIRGKSAEALGRLGDKRAIDSLITALADENELVRGRAVEALSQWDDIRVTTALAKLESDPSNWVRNMAQKALNCFRND
jgi:HEAT repeat protein/energy-coupling factor transporter ATP-binding protein EcfA2